MGPQEGLPPSFGKIGGFDPDIRAAIAAVLTVAERHGFSYDASGSPRGRCEVTAMWQGRPVRMSMRFFRADGRIWFGYRLYVSEDDDALLEGGELLEEFLQAEFIDEAHARGVAVYADHYAFI